MRTKIWNLYKMIPRIENKRLLLQVEITFLEMIAHFSIFSFLCMSVLVLCVGTRNAKAVTVRACWDVNALNFPLWIQSIYWSLLNRFAYSLSQKGAAKERAKFFVSSGILHQNFLAEGKLCADAQMVQKKNKCIQMMKLAYVTSACLSHCLVSDCPITCIWQKLWNANGSDKWTVQMC